MTESRRARWLFPVLVLLTTFLAPLACIVVGHEMQGMDIWLLFPWQPFEVWTNRVIDFPMGFIQFPFNLNIVHDLVMVWVALGALLSLAVQRDLGEPSREGSLVFSLIVLVLQMLLPFFILTMAKSYSISSYLVVPLPIPSVISLLALLLVPRDPSGPSQKAGHT